MTETQAGRPVVMVGVSASVWWVSLGLVLLVVLLAVVFPRYEVSTVMQASAAVARPPYVVRVDRWTGRVEVAPTYYQLTPVRAPAWLSVLPVTNPVASVR